MNIDEIAEKYSNIEDKIPSKWKDYELAGIELAQDIMMEWDIRNGELIRVISLISIRVPRLREHLTDHIDRNFIFYGLYPEKIRSFDVQPKPLES